MKILIIGLGIIGGSYARGLKKKGHTIYGVDKNENTLKYAMENGFLSEASTDPKKFIHLADLIVIGLYPKQIIPFLEENHDLFRKGQIITDVCGIKGSICENAALLSLPASYVGSHPMAGREKIGIEFADEKIFIGANFLICPLSNTEAKAIEVVTQMANDLGFGNIHLITPAHHDRMIAYTSQLTHAIAVSLVNSETAIDVTSFIGDSYRDLTRIAMINDKLWSELFLDNKTFLIGEIDSFIDQLNLLKSALISDNSEELKKIFKKSKARREVM